MGVCVYIYKNYNPLIIINTIKMKKKNNNNYSNLT